MASVHYLIEGINSFRLDLYNRTNLIQTFLKKRILAAITIQRYWRGYWTRQQIKRLVEAAVKIQTAFRGWIVRWYMPKYIADYIQARNNRIFNAMATRIGASWRGYWVRKNLPDSQNMVKRKKLRELMEREAKKTVAMMGEYLNRLRGGPKSKEQIEEEEQQCKQWVLYILYKCHHLLRTIHIPGVYSNNNNDDLTFVEQLMKSLPMREYMDCVRSEYYEMLKQEPPKTPHIYEERAARKLEDSFKLRYKLDDVKSTTALNIDANINQTPFDLNTKIRGKPYEKLLEYQDGPYTGSFNEPLRKSSEPKLNVSTHNFVLSKKVVKIDPKVPPYYIDNWDKPKCNLHFPKNIAGDYS